MSSIEIDPFHASASIVNRLPPGPAKQLIEGNLSLPVSRGEFLDLITANARIAVTISTVLVAIQRKDDVIISSALSDLLNDLQRNTTLMGELTARLLTADAENRVGPMEHGDG